MLKLPNRTTKPREVGLTCITDTGLTINQTANMLEDFGEYLDVAKLGIGTGFITGRLPEKLKLYRDAGVICYFGGSLFEKYYHQNLFSEYIDYLDELGVDAIEISSGILDVSNDELANLVPDLTGRFTVFCEVGCKDAAAIMAPSQWIGEINNFFDAGADYVITEGRDSGTAGIFRESGELRTGLIQDISALPNASRIIFEAPTGSSQMYFINLIGPGVNLGNIKPSDIATLEAQRVGLRYETFFVE